MMRAIVAVDRMLGMATDDGIPWDLPTDRQFFHDAIADGAILMGYGTYAEVRQPLHGRDNYVATRRTEQLRPGFIAVPDAAEFVRARGDAVVNNIGGAGLFTALLPLTDELLVTMIDEDFACTKFFPRFDDVFERIDTATPLQENGLTFTFQTWRRRPGNPGANPAR